MEATVSKTRGFRFSDLKLAYKTILISATISIAIVTTLVVTSGAYVGRTMTSESEIAFKEQVQGLANAADLAYKIAENQLSSVAQQFDKEFRPNLFIDSSQLTRINGLNVPAARLGEAVLTGNTGPLEQFTDRTGAVATVFVKQGEDFVRVSTSLKDQAGKTALGTALSREGAAYKSLSEGSSFIGRSDLFGADYMTSYQPLLDKTGTVVGALFVGLDLAPVKESLFSMFRRTTFGENGYAYVADVSPGAKFGELLVHPDYTGDKLQELVDGSGNTGTLLPILQEENGLFGYKWFSRDGVPDDKFVAFTRSPRWQWVIAGGIQQSEITGLATKLQGLLATFGAVGLLVLVVLLWLAITRSMKPLAFLQETVHKLAAGDDEARAKLATRDEIGELGAAFDTMMDERVATQQRIQRENDDLNASVLSLLQAVAQLSRKDLTVKVPVTEDVTGAVADALNLLTKETGKVLLEVSDISADVTTASLKVKQQSDKVIAAAKNELADVEHTAESLATASNSMVQIAELARVCNDAAENAISTTQRALETVTNTVGGINSTRDVIRETEKRIKRLGERSQEISGVVNLINTIAERTHILALNASMHAASAGEAGRGFAVVADEVQRLAESARQATAQIATLVQSIQVETADTVNTMNTAIAQVVEGSKLAEIAGEQMQRTQSSTSELVAMVQQIAVSSSEQAQTSKALLERAAEIRRSSQETSQRLQEQGEDTNNLVEYARNLLSTVRVFKLPA